MSHPLLELRDMMVPSPAANGVVLSISSGEICNVATKDGAVSYPYTGPKLSIEDKVRINSGLVSGTKTPTETYHF